MPSSTLRLARRVGELRSSPIRDILAAAQRPEVISFAGGLPATELLPTLDDWRPPRSAGQYGPSEGEPLLREQVAASLRQRGLEVAPEQVLITAGSQQGIDLAAKLLLDPGDAVALEAPSYLAALQVFSLFEARAASLGSFAAGADFDRVERVLAAQPKLAYLVPTFQNPTGYAYSEFERQRVAELLDRHRVPLLEDEPYRELDYAGDAPYRPIAARLERAPWIYQGTFSKVLLPGLRIGYVAASAELLPLLTRLKQAADLHTQRLGQLWVSHWLASGRQPQHLAELVRQYTARRDAMEAQLQQHFADIASWRVPQGGLFHWLRLQRPRDTRELMAQSLEAGVAFMPGEPFFAPGEEQLGYLRLNFSHADPARLADGVARLRRVFD